MSQNQENWWTFFITSKRLEEFQWNLQGRCDKNMNNIMNNKNMIILKDKSFDKTTRGGKGGAKLTPSCFRVKM